MEFKLAGIDIGSNACRLQITHIINPFTKKVQFHEVDTFRLPVRLGGDVFTTGFIGEEKKAMLLKAMIAFKNIMDVHGITKSRACATSAMRDAKNAKEILQLVKNNTDIDLEIIDGAAEANYTIHSRDEPIVDEDKHYLFVEIGGGSTQISIIHRSQVYFSHSYQIGTVRMLADKVTKQYWDSFKQDLANLASKYDIECAVGAGGNLNRIQKILSPKSIQGKLLDKKNIELLYQELKELTVEQRIERYKFNEDRADVILPAAKIITHILRATNLNKLLVPRVSLLDGIIKHIYLDMCPA